MTYFSILWFNFSLKILICFLSRSLIEVLTTSIQFDYFKRFMTMHKLSLPLMFWKSVEDLQEMSNGKLRQIRVTQILRKFFGKYAKYGNNDYFEFICN